MVFALTREPDLAEVIEAGIDTAMEGLNTCIPGVILNYYPTTQTADVQLANKSLHQILDTDLLISEEYPTLPNVPVCFPSGGGIHVTFPLQQGDNCILLFSKSDINNFRANNTPNNEPGLIGLFSLSGSMCIPTRVSNSTYTPMYVDSDSVVISKGGLAAFAARADLIEAELQKIKTAHDTHVHILSIVGTTGTAAPPVIKYTPGEVACTTLKIE